jgi:hypothetical protein
VSDWVKNSPYGNRTARIFYRDKEYLKVVIKTASGALIFGTLPEQAYDRVDIDVEGNFLTIAYSVFEGTRNTKYKGMQGRRLIHKMTLIKEEVEFIETEGYNA